MLRTRWFLATLLICSIACSVTTTPGEKDFTHYDIRLQLDPEAQTLRVQLELELHAVTAGADSIRLYLHKQFMVNVVEGPSVAGYVFDTELPIPQPFMPEAGELRIALSHPLEPGETVPLLLEYEGQITRWPPWLANVVMAEWVEIGNYLPWFPVNDRFGPFTFRLEVECDSVYQVRSYGDYTQQGKDWSFDWQHPAMDIVVVAAKNLRSRVSGGTGLKVRTEYVTIADTTAQALADDLLAVLDLLTTWFGDDRLDAFAVIQSPRERGGGYARRGAIVLGGLTDTAYYENREGYLRYLSHEASHLWWSMAPSDSWHDWLNEGFAEYTALLVVKEQFGDEAFARRLHRKRETCADSGPIWGFNRTDRSTDEKAAEIEELLYAKAPVLLHKLRLRVGQEDFLRLARAMVDQNVASTQMFLQILESQFGETEARWFEALLRS
jgi:hypothetical protein